MVEKPKVLVVDDDQRMVRTICDILRVKGYEVERAYSGEEALDMVAFGRPDCVLMDVKMPGIDGVQALKRIKGASPGIPVLLMSADASEEQAAEAKRHHAAALLVKPIDVQQLLSFLSLLGKHRY